MFNFKISRNWKIFLSIAGIFILASVIFPDCAFAQNSKTAVTFLDQGATAVKDLMVSLRKFILIAFLAFVAIYSVVKGVQMINGDPQAKDSLIKTLIVAVVVFLIVELALTGGTQLIGA